MRDGLMNVMIYRDLLFCFLFFFSPLFCCAVWSLHSPGGGGRGEKKISKNAGGGGGEGGFKKL